jgi:hypothetical protein
MNYLIPLNRSITNGLDSGNQNKGIVYNSQLDSFVPGTIPVPVPVHTPINELEPFIPVTTPSPIPHIPTKIIKRPDKNRKYPVIIQRIIIIFTLLLFTIILILLSYYVSTKYKI